MEYSYIVRIYRTAITPQREGTHEPLVGLVENIRSGSKELFHSRDELVKLLLTDDELGTNKLKHNESE